VEFLDGFAISRKLEGFFAKSPRDVVQPRATGAGARLRATRPARRVGSLV
jgi:hypothetical protein